MVTQGNDELISMSLHQYLLAQSLPRQLLDKSQKPTLFVEVFTRTSMTMDQRSLRIINLYQKDTNVDNKYHLLCQRRKLDSKAEGKRQEQDRIYLRTMKIYDVISSDIYEISQETNNAWYADSGVADLHCLNSYCNYLFLIICPISAILPHIYLTYL